MALQQPTLSLSALDTQHPAFDLATAVEAEWSDAGDDGADSGPTGINAEPDHERVALATGAPERLSQVGSHVRTAAGSSQPTEHPFAGSPRAPPS